MWRPGLLLPLLAPLLFPCLSLAEGAAQAGAQGGGEPYLVRRKDGASFVGHVTTADDGALLVRLATGEVVLVPRSELLDLDRISALRGPAAPSIPAADLTEVRLSSDRSSAVLERLDPQAEDETWRTACAPPCGRRLDNRYSYRIGGEGVVPSEKLDLSGPLVSLRVEAASRSWQRAGLGLFIGGHAAMAAGLGCVASIGLSTTSSKDLKLPAAGGGLLGAGLLFVVPGAVLLFGRRTKVVRSNGPDQGPLERGPKKLSDMTGE